MPRYLRGTTLVHDYYLPYLAEIDKRIGRKARVDLQQHYDFLDSWIAGISPTEALQQALDDMEARLAQGSVQ